MEPPLLHVQERPSAGPVAERRRNYQELERLLRTSGERLTPRLVAYSFSTGKVTEKKVELAMRAILCDRWEEEAIQAALRRITLLRPEMIEELASEGT